MTSLCQDIYNTLCRKYPDTDIYCIGDQHFYHSNIINYSRFNFASVTEMNEYIIKMHNATVTDRDIVIFLGDFCFKNIFIPGLLERMHGHKFLILGNHDSDDLIKHYFALGFEGVFVNPVRIGNIYLSHEPLVDQERADLQFNLIVNEFQTLADAQNYHGHIHIADSSLTDQYHNATCEELDYKPIKIGRTKHYEPDSKPLFINTPHFNDVVAFLKDKQQINPNLYISDFIYATILETFNSYSQQYYVQGSYGLLKKYSYLSRMSDLDIVFIYNEQMSKHKNSAVLKEMVDASFQTLSQIDGTNLSFWKRFISLRGLEILYSSPNFGLNKCYLDANAVFLDSYRESDFISSVGQSLIEKYLPRYFDSLPGEYHFPHFTTKFLTIEGDLANLILQLLFQPCSKEKRSTIIKKINYLCKKALSNKTIGDLSDIFARSFLHNIAFFAALNRYDDIKYVQEQSLSRMEIVEYLPHNIKWQIIDLLENPHSIFQDLFAEIQNTNPQEMFPKVQALTRELKK